MFRTPPSTPPKKFYTSPQTPVKEILRTDKDKNCLFCGLDFSLNKQGSFYNVKISKGLHERIRGILGKSPSYTKESERVCKKCFPRLEALEKRTLVLKKDSQEIIKAYEKNKIQRITESPTLRWKRQNKDLSPRNKPRKLPFSKSVDKENDIEPLSDVSEVLVNACSAVGEQQLSLSDCSTRSNSLLAENSETRFAEARQRMNEVSSSNAKEVCGNALEESSKNTERQKRQQRSNERCDTLIPSTAKQRCPSEPTKADNPIVKVFLSTFLLKLFNIVISLSLFISSSV